MFGCNPNIQYVNKCIPTINAVKAGSYITIVYTVAPIASPFLGRLVDKLGKRGILVLISMIIFLFTLIIIKSFPWDIP